MYVPFWSEFMQTATTLMRIIQFKHGSVIEPAEHYVNKIKTRTLNYKFIFKDSE